LPAPFNIIAGAAGVAATIAQGYNQTQKLMSIKEGSSVSGGGGGSTPSIPIGTPAAAGLQPPTNNVNSGIVSRETNIDNTRVANETRQVVVVDEITMNQSRQANTEKVARI
jgi:hypothetical protein